MAANDASALVPATGPNAVGPSFQQQGSVDWVALGQQQFSVSIAILGRLSSAGVEPLTVAVGQAICSRIPLGTHGEKMLSDAMAGLKACSSFGDIVWFGVGVRHILRVLVQTSQGASLVAICAALSEGHNIPIAALVLYEMAKRFGSPTELTPSFAQWQALVKVCASAFCHTNLSIKVDQILRLAGYDMTSVDESQGMVGHPEDLAQIILVIGDVASGRLLNVSILGGPACSWIAVFADSILGLRVMVKNSDEHILFTNFDTVTTEAQVVIEFDSQIPRGGITCVGRMYVLRPGDGFIRHFFRALGAIDSPSATLSPSLGGRVSRDTMLYDTFGDIARNFLHQGSYPKGMSEIIILDLAFVNFFIAGATFYVYCTAECARYADLHEFIHSATVNIPELNQLKGPLLKAAESIRYDSINSDTICRNYQLARNDLVECCQCSAHVLHSIVSVAVSHFCMVTVAETILILSYLLGFLRMAMPIHPRRIGILNAYEGIKRRQGWYRHVPNSNTTPLKGKDPQIQWDFKSISSCLLPTHGPQRTNQIFSFYMSIFSGDSAPPLLETNSVSAISDGRLFCFVDSVRELSDRYDRASVVHIGPGSIQAGYSLHYRVYDGQNVEDMRRNCYQTPRVGPLCADIKTSLQQDTTSPELEVTAIVEENIRLLFWYRLSSRWGNILISPTSFVDDYLTHALEYKQCASIKNTPTLGKDRMHSTGASEINLHDPKDFVAAYGEGFIPQPWRESSSKVILRGHCSNTLGRCAAIATSPRPIALLDQETDLEKFAGVLNADRSAYGRKDNWTLI